MDNLAQSDLAKKLIFYGGTSLRLAYGSPRFSEDMDFLMIEKVTERGLKKVIENLITDNPNIILTSFPCMLNILKIGYVPISI